MFDLARRPPQWLRVVLAAVLLGFALNSIAHVAHQHDATAASAAHSLACGYCASFGGLADAPRHTYAPASSVEYGVFVTAHAIAVRTFEPPTSARPRAPPVS